MATSRKRMAQLASDIKSGIQSLDPPAFEACANGRRHSRVETQGRWKKIHQLKSEVENVVVTIQEVLNDATTDRGTRGAPLDGCDILLQT